MRGRLSVKPARASILANVVRTGYIGKALKERFGEEGFMTSRERVLRAVNFTQVRNIQQTVPVENVEAMFEAAYEFGRRTRTP